METLGSYLKSEREKKGIRLEEIASITKIHIHSLIDLEEDRYDKLPPEPFIRGFITAYAKYVGLDSKDTIRRYAQIVRGDPDATLPEIKAQAPPTKNVAPTSGASGITKWKVAATGLTLAVIAVTISLIYIGKSSETQTLAADSELSEEDLSVLIGTNKGVEETDEAVEELVKKEESILQKFPPIKQANSERHELGIVAKARTWMKIVIDDKKPREFFLDEGKSVSYKAKEKIRLVIGNANGTEIKYNGKTAKGIRYSSGVSAFVYPAGAKFPQDVVARPIASEEKKEEKITPENAAEKISKDEENEEEESLPGLDE